MKITGVEIIPVTVPRPGFNRPDRSPVYVAVARLRTDEGLEGLGHTMSPRLVLFRTLVTALEELGQLLIGEDPREPERLYQRLTSESTTWFGPEGLLDIAICALDIAVWDLAAKACAQPLYRLLGGYRNRVPAYASTRLSRSLSTEELSETAADLVQQGFRAMKMNVGGQPTPEAEETRVRVVREAVGNAVALMADATWLWTPSEAIRAGRRLEAYQLTWLEDPIPPGDFSALARIAAALDTPIATGERYFGVTPFRYLLESNSVDIPMVDLMRCGGVTPFRKVAALAEAFGMPIVSHLQYEVFTHLIAAVPNGLFVEWMPWTSPVFEGLPELREGHLVLSERPGHGLRLDETFVRVHRTT